MTYMRFADIGFSQAVEDFVEVVSAYSGGSL